MVIKIIGKGAWGNCIAEPLKENGHTVKLLGRGEIALSDADIVVLAIPTNAIREALQGAKTIKGLTIINCSKGIELTTHKLPFAITKEILHPTTRYFTLLGPSFAHELQEKMPTLVNLGFTGEEKEAKQMKKLFETSYLRIHLVSGVASLELGGAMKNIYAIACGVADGLGFGVNTRIKLVITAIEEYYRLCEGLGYALDTRGVGGVIGDFMLTGSSTLSRNFQFGKSLVKYPVEEALQQVGATVEGYTTISSLTSLMNQAKVHLPLAFFVEKIVTSKKKEDIRQHFLDFVKNV